jgi:hypothetical protein
MPIVSNSMTPNALNSPAVTCAESIALLHLLHSVAAPPSRNSIDRLRIREKGYTLSFQQERSLAGTLAFLSNLKDGPDHIPAICIEQNPDPAFLNVLLAVNGAGPGAGKEVLHSLKLGFERIFALLSQMSNSELTIFNTRLQLMRLPRQHPYCRGSDLCGDCVYVLRTHSLPSAINSQYLANRKAAL